jgi:signal transduction histidine kinase
MSVLEKKLTRAIKAKEVLEQEIEKKTRDLYNAKNYSEHIIDTLSDALVITDDEGVISTANSTFRDYIYHDEVIGKNISEYIVDTDFHSIPVKVLQSPGELSCYFIWKEERREVLSCWRQILDQNNQIQNIFMFKDMTEVNKQLRSYANFAQLNPSPVFRIGADGKVLTANLVAVEFFDILDDFNWFEISNDLDEEFAPKLIKHSRIHVEEITYKGKYFYFQYRGIKAENYINIYGFDVTDQKLSEKKIKKLQDELIDQAYNQGVAENSVHVLHNIGNVLTSIIGKGDALKKDLNKKTTTKLLDKVLTKLNSIELDKLDEKTFSALKNTLGTIQEQFKKEEDELIEANNFTLRESLRISEIISTQQKYANLKTKVNSILTVSDLVQDIVTMHQYRLDKRDIQLTLDVCPKAQVYVEKVGLSQTISNAIVNAIESIDEKIKKDVLENSWNLEITTMMDGSDIVLMVADNGMGIDQENLKKLFSYGFSTKERGSGFGLHNCANYMKTIGGSIEILSDGVYKGAQTVIKIPVFEGDLTEN